MNISERELGLMDTAKAIVSFTAFQRREATKEKERFGLEVTISSDHERYTVTSARGWPRTWAQVNTLIRFIRDTCPNFVSKQCEEDAPVMDVHFGVSTRGAWSTTTQKEGGTNNSQH